MTEQGLTIEQRVLEARVNMLRDTMHIQRSKFYDLLEFAERQRADSYIGTWGYYLDINGMVLSPYRDTVSAVLDRVQFGGLGVRSATELIRKLHGSEIWLVRTLQNELPLLRSIGDLEELQKWFYVVGIRIANVIQVNHERALKVAHLDQRRAMNSL